MKIIISLFLLFTFSPQLLFSQDRKVINNESTHFQIRDKAEKIDFIVFDPEVKDKKPVFLWCQGSLPYPLYVNSKKDGLWVIGGGISNFDVKTIKKYYHLIIISMPNTPVIAEEDQINDSYWYFGNSKDKNEPSDDFIKSDYLENYVHRAIKVLKFLRKQDWVDSSKLIVAGHSQGSKVATKVAAAYKPVSKLGVFGANPFGRIDQNIRDYRKDAEKNAITWPEAEKGIEKEYQLYREANNPEMVRKKPYLLSWKSFSEPLIDDWLAFNRPIYMAYGTHDIASDLCDLVPLYFIRAHKNNLTYKRYLNTDHNFFEVESGETHHDKPHWEEAMNSFIQWTIQ